MYLIQTVCPVSDSPDVERDGVLLLGGRGDGEGVPLEVGDGGDVEEDVVAGLEGEVWRPLYDKVHHLAGNTVFRIHSKK